MILIHYLAFSSLTSAIQNDKRYAFTGHYIRYTSCQTDQSISESVDQPFPGWTRSEKEKISSEQHCGPKHVDVRGQRRMGRLVGDDTQTTTEYRIPS